MNVIQEDRGKIQENEVAISFIKTMLRKQADRNLRTKFDIKDQRTILHKIIEKFMTKVSRMEILLQKQNDKMKKLHFAFMFASPLVLSQQID